jgi:hypothetical protein
MRDCFIRRRASGLFTEDLLGAASRRDFFAHKGAPTSHCEARQRCGNLLLKIGIDLESQTADEENVEAVPHERIIFSVKKTGVIVAKVFAIDACRIYCYYKIIK